MVVTLLPLLAASKVKIRAAFAKAMTAFWLMTFGSKIFRALSAACANELIVLALLAGFDFPQLTIYIRWLKI